VEVSEAPPAPEYATQIIVEGYNHNQTELFNHDRLKDYIYWFTKFGSAEQLFELKQLNSAELHLQGLDDSILRSYASGIFSTRRRAYRRFSMHMTNGRGITSASVTSIRALCPSAAVPVPGGILREGNPR